MTRRTPGIGGLFATLLALMVQVAMGATVPRPDPAAAVFSAETLCHTETPSDGSHHKPPPLDCLVCPFCVALHAAAVALPDAPVLRPPGSRTLRPALPVVAVSPPPPPAWRPVQQRAPPTV
jgi:hypothetical protein